MPGARGLKSDLQPQLHHTRLLADRIHIGRAGQRRGNAAGLAEGCAGDRRRSRCRVTRVLKVGMIEDVEELRPQLRIETLSDAEVLGQSGVEIPKALTLPQIAPIALLSWRRCAEVGLRAGDVLAVDVRIIERRANEASRLI